MILYVYPAMFSPKSLYISHAVNIFYGTEIEIWASFWPVDNTGKQIWAEYEQLLGTFFYVFMAKESPN